MQPQFHPFTAKLPGAGGFVKQKRTQSTSVRISPPKIGKGKGKRHVSGKKDHWAVPTPCCLALCADTCLIWFWLCHFVLAAEGNSTASLQLVPWKPCRLA